MTKVRSQLLSLARRTSPTFAGVVADIMKKEGASFLTAVKIAKYVAKRGRPPARVARRQDAAAAAPPLTRAERRKARRAARR